MWRFTVLLICAVATLGQARTFNPIVVENNLPGTTDWKLTTPSIEGEIQGYSSPDSVNTGQTISFHISTTSPTYTIGIYRLGFYGGKGGSLKYFATHLTGKSQGYYINGQPYPSDCNSAGECTRSTVSHKDSLGQETSLIEANWALSFSLNIPSTWLSGYYLAKLHDDAKGTEWHIPFVVRNDSKPVGLYVDVPFDTDQAYNYWGGANVYRRFRGAETTLTRAALISYNRPYAVESGTGNLFFFEYPMIRFLEERGYNVGYTTSIAVATGLTNLARANGMLIMGHAEYISQPERAKQELFYRQGGAVAYFSGNDMYWQIRHQSDLLGNTERNFACYKMGLNQSPSYQHYVDPVSTTGPLGVSTITDHWFASTVGDPEDNFLKTDWGSGVKSGIYYPLVAANTSHWAFANTGLTDGSRVANVVGWETDKVNWNLVDHPGANEKVTVIGNSTYDTQGIAAVGVSNAVLTENLASGGLVFHAGSVVWNLGLADFDSYLHARQGYPVCPVNETLRTLTGNILTRMAMTPAQRLAGGGR